MKFATLCLVLLSAGAVLGRPRQEEEVANRLNEPLADPELRRTLLRVFAESLKAAAEAGAAGARSASNVPVEQIINLRPPGDLFSAGEGFSSDQQTGELLQLSGDTPRGRAASSGISFTTTEPPAVRNEESDAPFSLDLQGPTELLQGDSTNHGATSLQGSGNLETRTESSPAQPPAEPLFPGPSPAPPAPIDITLDETATGSKLSPADNEDVQRFVSAVKTSDETLGEGVELFQAPLIAAFALQQDGNTGLTRSLLALPVTANEDLLKQERQILSVAGQVIGTQRTGILPRFVQQQQQQQQQQQNNFGRTVFDIQRSVQPQFRQQDPLTLLNEVEPQSQLHRLERRQQELQQQLLFLQRERSALLHQRTTRGSPDESLLTAASSSPFTSIPIYLQPPFF